jgi:hypothetical protein
VGREKILEDRYKEYRKTALTKLPHRKNRHKAYSKLSIKTLQVCLSVADL